MQTEQEKKKIQELKKILHSKDDGKVIAALGELKSTGKPSFLPAILELLTTNGSERVKNEVLNFISDLKDDKCVDFIIEYIDQNKSNELVTPLIASCWQSRLNFSNNLLTFAELFITGDYNAALESFTVIEESLWQSSEEIITECRTFMIDHIADINQNKKPLYNELIKILEEGKTNDTDPYLDV